MVEHHLDMVVVGGSIPLVPTRNRARSISPARLSKYSVVLLFFEVCLMPVITLPDGSKKDFDKPLSVADVAANIGPGLAKSALAGKVNGQLVDTSHVIEKDAELAVITDKDSEGLEIIRHSTAHLLAHAVKQLFPDVQVTIGPVIENGFYYDFAYKRGFTPEDLERIETRMNELAKADHKVTREVIERDDAIALFLGMGEKYKAEIIKEIPKDEALTLYKQDDFIDLCRGPHVPGTQFLQAFKLMKLAGAYWRGDSNNEMLQRIYGTAWTDKKSLKNYLQQLEEAEKRDHRKLAKQMNLFHFQEEAPGMVFWHGRGYQIFQVIEQYIRELIDQFGYHEIRTPELVDQSLWEKSGHWSQYSEEMFTTKSENRLYAIKPMSCPCHVQVYKQGIRSYRDLPLRLAEFGNCHRNEFSGSLHGLMRLRNFTQDDAHIFCTKDQIYSEVSSIITQVLKVYSDFGFDDVMINLSTRPDKRVGADAIWDKAEHALEEVLNKSGYEWQLQLGEGAFYGPKIDFTLRDCIGRTWQCGTIQLDFSMPARLEAYYIAEDGSRQVPVMIHRATLGSLERFIGILIEHYAGKLPVWLAPIQVVVMNITDHQREYCVEIVEFLKKLGIRVISDLRNEKISFKIREHTLQKVSYQLIVGDKELSAKTVALRTLGGKDLGSMQLEDFTEKLKSDISNKS